MTITRAQGNQRIPQLIPHRSVRNNQVHHPAVLEEAKRRSDNVQLRVADRITALAGFSARPADARRRPSRSLHPC
jgi:hypothetical protein